MRVVLMATGDIAEPCFHALHEKAWLVGLVTQPDRPVGRHQVLTPPPLKVLAEAAGIPVLQPETMRSPEAIRSLAFMQPDLLVVMAYGQILTEEVINLGQLGCINAHASLLPRHRGAACIQATLDAGDSEAGVTIMHVVKKLDAGDMIAQKSFRVRGTETAADLHQELAAITPSLMCEVIELIAQGKAGRTEQEEALATYAPKLLRQHGLLDWTQPNYILERKIRAYHTWPGTWTNYVSLKGQKRNLKIFPHVDLVNDVKGAPGEVLSVVGGLTVACGKGAVRIHVVQPEGSRLMSSESFSLGHKLPVHSVFGAVDHE